jgi:hypothetical protein
MVVSIASSGTPARTSARSQGATTTSSRKKCAPWKVRGRRHDPPARLVARPPEGGAGHGAEPGLDRGHDRRLQPRRPDQTDGGEPLPAVGGGDAGGHDDEDDHRDEQEHGAEQEEHPYALVERVAAGQRAEAPHPVQRPRGHLAELVRRASDERDELVGMGEPLVADGRGDAAGIPVVELVVGRGHEEPAHRRGDRDLARPGEALQARRHRRTRPKGRHVAADHGGALVVVGDRQEQRGIGCGGRRRRVGALPPGPLRAPLLGRLAGQAEQQQHHADGDAERRDPEPQQRLPSTGDGQPQAEPEGHGAASPRASTPSRTSTVRSA